MASLLIETTGVGIRVVAFNSVLEPYIDGRWLLHDYQVMQEWRINASGHVTRGLPAWNDYTILSRSK